MDNTDNTDNVFPLPGAADQVHDTYAEAKKIYGMAPAPLPKQCQLALDPPDYNHFRIKMVPDNITLIDVTLHHWLEDHFDAVARNDLVDSMRGVLHRFMTRFEETKLDDIMRNQQQQPDTSNDNSQSSKP